MLPARGKQIYDTVAGGLGMFTDPMMAIPGGLSVRALAKLKKLEKEIQKILKKLNYCMKIFQAHNK